LSRPLRWQLALALAQPPLSVLYLLLVHRGRLAPSFAPLGLLALLPLASAAVGLTAWRSAPPATRSRHGWLVALAVLELAWTGLAQSMIGFAIAWRSG
jgi:hypothetical protein